MVNDLSNFNCFFQTISSPCGSVIAILTSVLHPSHETEKAVLRGCHAPVKKPESYMCSCRVISLKNLVLKVRRCQKSPLRIA